MLSYGLCKGGLPPAHLLLEFTPSASKIRAKNSLTHFGTLQHLSFFRYPPLAITRGSRQPLPDTNNLTISIETKTSIQDCRFKNGFIVLKNAKQDFAFSEHSSSNVFDSVAFHPPPQIPGVKLTRWFRHFKKSNLGCSVQASHLAFWSSKPRWHVCGPIFSKPERYFLAVLDD